MYYNLTEDQKIFLETSYSMIKAGYTLEEVEGFWSSEDEDNVKNILESVDYVDIDRKDADLQEVVGMGARILGGIGLAIKGARTAKKLNQLRKLAQIARPTAAQRSTAFQLKKSLGQSADDITFAWQQAPKDKLAQAVTKTTGADDVLKTVRPGSSGSATVRGSASSRPTEVIQQQTAAIDRQTKAIQQTVKNTQPTTATTTAATTTTKVASKLPKQPPSKVKNVVSGLLGTAVTGGALLYTPSSERADNETMTTCPYGRKADGNCKTQASSTDTTTTTQQTTTQQTTTQQQPPTTTTTTTQQQTPPTTQPSTTSTKRKSNKVDWRSWHRQNLPR